MENEDMKNRALEHGDEENETSSGTKKKKISIKDYQIRSSKRRSSLNDVTKGKLHRI